MGVVGNVDPIKRSDASTFACGAQRIARLGSSISGGLELRRRLGNRNLCSDEGVKWNGLVLPFAVSMSKTKQEGLPSSSGAAPATRPGSFAFAGITNPLESQHGFAEFDRVAAMHPFRANGGGQLCRNGNPAAGIRQ
jgi:hypothetical protein